MRNHENNALSRVLAFVLTLCLLLQACPVMPVFAAEDEILFGTQDEVVVEEAADEFFLTGEEEPVEVPNAEEPVVEGEIVVSEAGQLPAEIAEGTTVVLDADITLNADQQITLIAGVLDGKGYTITLSGKPLAAEVTGTVQNLGVAGTVKTATDPAASVADHLNGGTIQNSFSTADISGTSMFAATVGLAGTAEGAAIRNCFFAGKLNGMDKAGLVGQCNNEQNMSTFVNSYFNETDKVAYFGHGYNETEPSVAQKTLEEMKAPEFVELLNADIVDTGFVWAVSEGALPVLAAADVTPEPPALDYTGLNAVINEAKDLLDHEMEYTEESFAAMRAALIEGEGIRSQEAYPTQEEINTAAANLRAAIDGLQKVEAADPLAELKALVAECKALKAEDYTPDTWGPFAEMLGDAEAAIERNESDPEIIGFTYQDLLDAKGRLVKAAKPEPADPLAELKALVAEAEQLKQEDYTPESWEPFSYNLEDAKACIKRNETDPEQIGYAVNDLKNGMAALQPAEPKDPNAVDTTKLQEAIDAARALKKEAYTEDTWAALELSLASAEMIAEKPENQEQVNTAEAELRAAIAGLKRVPADKSKLEAAIAEAKALNEKDYTDGSWGNMYTAIMLAEIDMKNPNVTQETIDNHEKAVREAMANLKLKIVVTELQAAIDEAKALNEKDYTPESWAAMQEKLIAAEDEVVYQHSQEQVDAAEAALRQAVKDLKKPGQGVDKSKLEAAIAEAKALKESDYTDTSWGALNVAIMLAEMDIDKSDVTQETIDNHEKAVREAMANLKLKIVVTELQAAIDEAKALNEKDYTPESWAVLQEKLTAAEDEVVYQHSQEQVDAAAAALRQAVKDLKPVNGPDPTNPVDPDPTNPVDPDPTDPSVPQGNVIEVATGDEMPDAIAADTTVVLTADITMTRQITRIEGVLDGRGHTVTVAGQALAAEVTGTVQNLGVLSTAPIKAAGVYPTNNGPIAINLNGGVIQACYSTAALDSFFDNLGGLVGVSVGGTVRNSYFAGTISGKGVGGLVGASQNVDQMTSITDSYFAGVDKPVSAGNAYNENDPTVGQKTLDFMKTAAFAELLNANMPNTGYHWEVVDGNLPTLLPGRPEGTPDANTEALAAVIKEAGELVETKYTAESWQAMQTALAAAKEIMKNSEANQDQIDKAAADLRAAIDGLREKPVEIPTEAVALPDTGVIEITSQKQIQKMTAENTKGNYYRLANDIVIDDGYWINTSFAGVLDGSGYTINVLNKNPIFEYITAEAVIQNVGFLGEVKGFGMDIGGVATDSSGLIVNCWNRMTVSTEGSNGVRKDSGAFVAHLKKGGAIVNSYVAGKVFSKGDKGAGVPGAFAATSEVNTLVKNGMYLNTSANNPVGSAAGEVVNCTRQKRGGFYSQENLAALNANRGTYGKEWTIDNDGWFHLGAAGNFDPSVGSGMRFTFAPIYNRDPIDFSSGDGIELSMGDFLIPADTEGEMPRILGTFSNPNFDGQIALVPEYTAVGQGNHGVMTYDDGGLVVSYPGDLTVHVMDKASWSGTGYEKELTSFTIVVTSIEAEELRLIPHGKYVDPEQNTIQGSGNVVTEAQVKVNGQWMKGNPTSFGFTIEGKVFGEGDGFRPTAPGKIKIGCSGFGKSATLEMESLYVPVTLIRPYPYGVHWLHERDANSNKLGNFLDLNLADQAGRVYIEPENASYNGDGSWKMESSDPKVAEYIPDFLLAVLPYKAGKVTLTAISLDPNLKEPVTGTSEIELKYLNPVTAVEVNLNELDEAHLNAETGHMILQGDEEISLPIHFTGTKEPELHEDPNDGIVKEFSWHVSEPEMIWYQEGDGEVEIVIDGNTGMWVKTPIENCVANDSFKITGVVNGTVTVTGIPADKTNKVEPVTFTVEVSGVTAPEPYNVQGFIDGAKPSAITGVYSRINYMCGSDEWQVLSLLRAGEALPQDKLDAYYKSVMDTIPGWSAGKKPTDFERVALALSAMGKDITALTYTDKEGNEKTFNLAERIYNHKYLSDGSNEVTFALIALDARNTAIPEGALNTRQSMVDLLLTFQNEDGGFGLAPGGSSGADTTSMSLQALAPYQDQPLVAAAIENGLVYLKNNVHTKAGHFDQGTVESNAQTIIAMAVLGRDLIDEPGFSSARYNLMKAMEPYHVGGEGFKHTAVDPKINAMATAQALQALDAYDRFLHGKTGYWDFTDQNTYPDINTDGHAAADALDQIHRLPDAADVAERDRKAIESARAAYNALSPAQKALVDDSRLVAAEEALANLGKPDPDMEAAQAVMDLIEKLPAEITLDNKADVQAARAAFEKLTPQQMQLVTNLDKLKAAEKKIQELEGGDKPAPGNVVYFDVERFAIGQGFFTEPVVVEFTEGQSYADIIDKVLGEAASIRDNHNYLEMIKGANAGPEAVNIPDYIVEMSKNKKTGVPTCTTEIVRKFYTDRGFEAWGEGNLGEFTYSTQAGWVYSVNDIYPDIGIGENKVQPGDVIRLQYTVFGLGRDVQDPMVTDMDNLVKAMALVNAENADIINHPAVQLQYNKAKEIMADMVHAKAEVDDTAAALLEALETAKTTGAVEYVQNAIAKLPENVALENKAEVENARALFDLLTEEQKKAVANADKLVAAEKTLADLAVMNANKLIEAIPEQVTLNDKEAVQAAKTAFDALTKEQQALVSEKNQKKLADAVKALDKLLADEVTKLIEAIPEKVTEKDKAAVEAAQKAFEALTEAQKALVSEQNQKKLADAVKALGVDTAVENVTKLIEALPEKIQLKDKAAVEAAKAAFDALTDAQKAKISKENKAKLDAAVKKIQELENQPKPVDHVTDKAYGATMKAPGLTDDMALVVTTLGKDDAAVNLMRKAIPSNEGLIKIYDVKLVKGLQRALRAAGQEIELTGKATLQLPVDRKYDGQTLKVLFVGKDNKVKTLEGKVDNGLITLEVQELGAFGIVVSVKKTDNGGSNSNGGGSSSGGSGSGSGSGGKGPAKTGDETPVFLLTGISVVSLAGLAALVALLKKKRNSL